MTGFIEIGKNLLWPSRHPAEVSCDSDGPAIGPIRLLEKGPTGFQPQPIEVLNGVLSWTFGRPYDAATLVPGLRGISNALNRGELARAMIATQFMRLPTLGRAQARRASRALELLKAAVDDPKHPGWPANTPGGLGGKFRPKDVPLAEEARRQAAENLRRYLGRRSLRVFLRGVLTWRRLARLTVEAGSNAVPIVDTIGDAALAADIAELAWEMHEFKTEGDAALEFVKKGPYTLDQLRVDREDRSFRSFGAFKKIDMSKYYHPAPPGYQYHHIVEQGASGNLPETEVQSTRNIILIPTLLHEEIGVEYGSLYYENGTQIQVRALLRGKSFEEQYKRGLETLRRVGILL